jgi:hypothetical protein
MEQNGSNVLQYIVEAVLPRRERGSLIPEDEIIPLLPYAPNHQGQNIQEGTLSVLLTNATDERRSCYE